MRLLGRLQSAVLSALAIGPIWVDRRGRKTHADQPFHCPAVVLKTAERHGWSVSTVEPPATVHHITPAGLVRLEQDEERRQVATAVRSIAAAAPATTLALQSPC